MKFFIQRFFLLIMVSFSCRAHDDALISYHEYVAPDKIHVVQVTHNERNILLVIKNQQTGMIEASMENMPLILNTQWSPDSTSLVIVQHLSKCSLVSLIHHYGSKWEKYDCEPQTKFMCNFSVLGIKFLKKSLQLTYGISRTQGNGLIIDFQKYIYNVDYQNGIMTLLSAYPITLDIFMDLRNKEEKSWVK